MEGEFEIYQTAAGVTAVTNSVQRQIMGALAKGDQQLPTLVELTGKAKPTLSSIHMKELLNRELIEEVPHPTDSRRKIYRAIAKRVGSSSLPVDALRSAVKQYAAANAKPGIPLVFVLEGLAAANDAPRKVLEAQAIVIGRACAGKWAGEGMSYAKSFSQYLEQETLGTPMSADFENHAYKFRKTSAKMTGTMAGHLLCSLFNGAAEAQAKTIRCSWEGGSDWFVLKFQ